MTKPLPTHCFTSIYLYGYIYDSPQHLCAVIKQVACAGHRSSSLCHSLPSSLRCFITVTRAQAKRELREQSIHLESLLLGSCGAGEGQSEAEGISKLLCLLDLSVTLCSLSVKSLSLPLCSPFPLFLCRFLALGVPNNFPLAILFSSSSVFVCF